ncbi:MAG: 7-cyano-7-deazaguanine synthase [Terriglobia bacterium]
MTERQEKAVVLVSGGMDSCVTAALAAQDHRLAFLHASYGQRTARREQKAFSDIADFYGVAERLVIRLDHFRAIGGSSLTDEQIPVRPATLLPSIPQARPGRLAGLGANGTGEANLDTREIPSSYVPFRNAHFLATAVSWGEVIGARWVFIGAVWDDSSGYPDCRPEYYQIFNELVRVGTRPETQLEIVTPLIRMPKQEIVRRGIELEAPLHLTWSCYQSEEEACGVCESCALRLRAFARAGVEDSIAYKVKVSYT